MKIIENKKDKLIVIVSALFLSLYAFGTVFAGALLKDEEAVLVPAAIPVSQPSDTSGQATNPAQLPPNGAATVQNKKTTDQNAKQSNDDDDNDDD